jgi:hypothetical protein
MMVGAATADEGLLDPPHELGLVERLKRGERAALGELYAAYGDRLFRAVILPRLPIRELAEDSLAQINPRYAQALRLRLLDDKDREECAALMDVTVATFDVILHRACKAFREKYPPR